jgi:hypothetical protein
MERGMTQLMAFDHAASGRVAHVAYPELVRDPTLVVESVYARLGVEAPKDLASRVGGYQAASAGKRAAAPNELPTFGLDHNAFLARPLVKSYCIRFGVEPEAARLTGVKQKKASGDPTNCDVDDHRVGANLSAVERGPLAALCGSSLAVEKNQALVVVGLIFVALHAIFMIEDAGSSRSAGLGAPRD